MKRPSDKVMELLRELRKAHQNAYRHYEWATERNFAPEAANNAEIATACREWERASHAYRLALWAAARHKSDRIKAIHRLVLNSK